MLPAYATSEELKSAIDINVTAWNDAAVLRVLDATSRNVEGRLHRRFYPQTATRTFDWPGEQRARPWRLWLDANELISVTTLTSAGIVVPSTDYFLRPDWGPPYTHVEIDLESPSSFSAGNTWQRAISITGVWGFSADEITGGTTAEVLDASETGVDITNASAVGVGALIRVDSEYMVVTAKTMLTSGQTLQTPLTASAANVTVAVTTGSAFTVGEVILLDAERMLIVDIAGNNLIVKRAWDGSTLALHATPTIYAPRTLTVERGAVGTTAASHLTAAPIYVHQPPTMIRNLTMGLGLHTLRQESVGYATTTGGSLSSSSREVSGAALVRLWDDAIGAYGRKARMRSV